MKKKYLLPSLVLEFILFAFIFVVLELNNDQHLTIGDLLFILGEVLIVMIVFLLISHYWTQR